MVFSTLQSVGNTLQNWGVSALMGVVRTGSSLISGTVEGAPKVVAGATKTHPLLGAAQRAPVVGRALRQQVDDVSDLVRELRVSEYIDSGLDTFERRVRPTAPSFGERLAEGVGSGLATLPFFYNIGTALPTINALATRAGVDAYWRAKEGGKSDQEAEEIEQKVYLQEVPNQAADAFITRGLVLGKGMLSSVKALRPLQGIAKSRGPVANVALAAAGESGTEVLQTLVSHTIAEQAQVGEWFDPWEAVDAVMQEPGLQEELVLAGLSAALVGGGVRGGIEYGKAKMSPMSRAASTALFNDLQPLMPSGATAEALNDLTETERTNALSVAVFRAIDRKNPLIPDQAIARAVERHGRGRNVDSVVAAMADNEQSFRTEEFGVALLPTYNEVALELVRMDAMGEKNTARREALIAEQEAAVAASPERRAQALATELAQKLPSFKRAQEEGRVAFVEGLIDGIARGKYQEGVISLSDTASVGTIAHEAWHDFYQLGMTADEQQRFRRDLTKRHGAMIEEQMQRHGIGRDEAELEVGAILAEQFVAEQRAPKTFLERMFDALRGFVADVVGPQSEVWDALERFGGADAQERFYTSGLRSPVLAGLSDGVYQRGGEIDVDPGYTTKMVRVLEVTDKESMSVNELRDLLKSKTYWEGGALSGSEQSLASALLEQYEKKVPIAEFLNLYQTRLVQTDSYDSDRHADFGLENIGQSPESEEVGERPFSRVITADIEGGHGRAHFGGGLQGRDDDARSTVGWYRGRLGGSGDALVEYVYEVQSDMFTGENQTWNVGKEGESTIPTNLSFLADTWQNLIVSKALAEADAPRVRFPTPETVARIEGFGQKDGDIVERFALGTYQVGDFVDSEEGHGYVVGKAPNEDGRERYYFVSENYLEGHEIKSANSEWGDRKEGVDKEEMERIIGRATGTDAEYVAKNNLVTMLRVRVKSDEKIDLASLPEEQKTVVGQYGEKGQTYQAIKRVAGKDNVKKVTDERGHTWWEVNPAKAPFDSPVLYQRAELEPVTRALREQGESVTRETVKTEYTKRLLRSTAAAPRTVDGTEYYPVYISVGNPLDGRDTTGLINGFFALDGDTLTDLTIERYDRPGVEGDVVGDMSIAKWNPAFTGTLMDTMTRLLRQDGRRTIRLGDDLQPITRTMIERYYGQSSGEIDLTKKRLPRGEPVRLSQPLYKRREPSSEVQRLLNEEGVAAEGPLTRSQLKRLVFFGERPKGTRLSGVAAIASAAVKTQGARIADIDPGSEAQLNKMYFNEEEVYNALVQDETLFARLTKGYNQLAAEEKKLLNIYLTRQTKDSVEKALVIGRQVGIADELQQLFTVFDRSHEALTAVGHKINKLDLYLPRKLTKDAKEKVVGEDYMQRFFSAGGVRSGGGVAGHFKQRTRTKIDADNIGDYEPVISYARSFLRSVSRFVASQAYFNNQEIVQNRAIVKTRGVSGKGIVQRDQDGRVNIAATMENKWQARARDLYAESLLTADGALIENGTPVYDFSFVDGRPVDRNGRVIAAEQTTYGKEAYDRFVAEKEEWMRLVGRLFVPKSAEFIGKMQKISALKLGVYGQTLAQLRIAFRASFENVARTSSDVGIWNMALGAVWWASGGRKVVDEAGNPTKLVPKQAKDYILDREKVEQEKGLKTEQWSNRLFGLSGWGFFKEGAVSLQKQAVYAELRGLVKNGNMDKLEGKYHLSTVIPGKQRREQALRDIRQGRENYDVNLLLFIAESRTDINSALQRPGWSAHDPLGNLISLMKTDLFKGYDYTIRKAIEPLQKAQRGYDKETARLVNEELQKAREENRDPDLSNLNQKQLAKAQAYIYGVYNVAKVYFHGVALFGTLSTLTIFGQNLVSLLAGGEDDDFERQMGYLVDEALLRQTGISGYDLGVYKESKELDDLIGGLLGAEVAGGFSAADALVEAATEPSEKSVSQVVRRTPIIGDIFYSWFLPKNTKQKEQFGDLSLEDLQLDLDVDIDLDL